MLKIIVKIIKDYAKDKSYLMFFSTVGQFSTNLTWWVKSGIESEQCLLDILASMSILLSPNGVRQTTKGLMFEVIGCGLHYSQGCQV